VGVPSPLATPSGISVMNSVFSFSAEAIVLADGLEWEEGC
jgi:hypothetical protein